MNRWRQQLTSLIMEDRTNNWYYLLPDGTTAPNMKELRSITGRSVTVLRKLIRKGEIIKITNKQMLRSYEREATNN